MHATVRSVIEAASNAADDVCILDTETGKSTPISPVSFGAASQANVWTP